ncbi:MAG: UDP-3-O-(3-hydroxymyristoyl)glucosamine N-acyltransferase [Victivallales bacterium]|nr:UDP-3-O-(3-hydroxymyristoyl)glucosamine N-acyltransferase [Victivallales bacterium]
MLISKTAEEIAAMVQGRLVGSCPHALHGVASLAESTEADVAFLGNDKYREQVPNSRAGVVLVPENYTVDPAAGRAWVVCADPSDAFTKVVMAFTPPAIEYKPGVHPRAVIDDSVVIPTSCHIGANVVIEAGASIGEGTVILPNVYIGQEAHVGANCLIYPNVTIRERCLLGNRVILHAGVVIGADGFGYKSSAAGHEKIPQVGIVQLDDDVEVGANSTIDRARFGRTWIPAGTKIDNLVQVAHNVEVGRGCILVAQSGIAGSTHLGNGVILAGQAGVVGHVRVGDGTIVMAQTGVTKDAMPGSVLMGTPAQDRKAFARDRLLLKKFEAMEPDLKALIKKAKEDAKG